MSDVSDTFQQQQERSHPRHATTNSQLLSAKGKHQMQVPNVPDLLNMPLYRVEQHTSGSHRVKHPHAEPLRSHPITAGHTNARAAHHQDEADALSIGSHASASSDTIESKVSTIHEADPSIEARSADIMTSSVEPVTWKMVNKGPVVLCSTPTTVMRDDEPFLDTDPASSSSLLQATWSHVQNHSPKVSVMRSLTQPLSADMIDRDENSPEQKEASSRTAKIPDLQPLVLNLPEGPSLHLEIFGRSEDEEIETHSRGERLADNLEEYTKYTGWIERK